MNKILRGFCLQRPCWQGFLRGPGVLRYAGFLFFMFLLLRHQEKLHLYHLVYSVCLIAGVAKGSTPVACPPLSLIVISIVLNKEGQDSPNSCSDKPTFNDLIRGSTLGRLVNQIGYRLK